MWQESSYGKKGGKLRWDYIWVNNATDAALAAQTLDLNVDLSEYDFISVVYQETKALNPETRWYSGLCKMSDFLGGQQPASSYPSGRPLMFGVQTNVSVSYCRYIAFTRDDETGVAHKIYISTGLRPGSSSSTSYCIIRQILGWKMTDVTEEGPI